MILPRKSAFQPRHVHSYASFMSGGVKSLWCSGCPGRPCAGSACLISSAQEQARMTQAASTAGDWVRHETVTDLAHVVHRRCLRHHHHRSVAPLRARLARLSWPLGASVPPLRCSLGGCGTSAVQAAPSITRLPDAPSGQDNPMRGFGSFNAAARFCTAHDELRDLSWLVPSSALTRCGENLGHTPGHRVSARCDQATSWGWSGCLCGSG